MGNDLEELFLWSRKINVDLHCDYNWQERLVFPSIFFLLYNLNTGHCYQQVIPWLLLILPGKTLVLSDKVFNHIPYLINWQKPVKLS